MGAVGESIGAREEYFVSLSISISGRTLTNALMNAPEVKLTDAPEELPFISGLINEADKPQLEKNF